tara:strand:- start:520 stop:678 length:159 start_codon:yes stop_codon:yes gene_type:complete
MKFKDFEILHWVLFAILSLFALTIIKNLINLLFWMLPAVGVGFLIYYLVKKK